MFWPVLAIWLCWISPANNWWFPGESVWSIGTQIDDLFHLLLIITTVVFIGTQIALGYVLWKGSDVKKGGAWFSHGSHNLEVIWTILPAGVLLFISLYQMDVLARAKVKTKFPEAAANSPIAEVTARQFEWRIRYPAPGKKLMATPQPTDLYTVNDLHIPVSDPVMIRLRSADVQHSFALPHLRLMQDAVPGMVIPVWFQSDKTGKFEIVCKELCGWGHYKMQGELTVELREEYDAYLRELQSKQNDDGYSATVENSVAQTDED